MKLAVFTLAMFGTISAFGQDLPEGEGKKQLQEICTGCHGLDAIVYQRNDKEGWLDIVNSMVDRGAPAKEDDVTKIVAYLTKNFGKDNKK